MAYPEADAPLLARFAREDAGLSQSALALRAGLRQPNIAAIESGARRPSAELLARVLDAASLRPSIPLEFYANQVHRIAAEHGLSNVRVFGSTITGEDTPRSDVDLLADAAAGVDFLTLAAFRQAVAELIGFPVDVVIDDGSATTTQIARNSVPL